MGYKSKKLLLVDSNDQEIGFIDKLQAHQLGLLHRAYSIFVFREKNDNLELLMQQRALHKYHSGGLWSNTCCSHPEPGIGMAKHVVKRLKQEMGFTTHLMHVGKFHYQAKLANNLIECEIDHLYVGFEDIEHVHFSKKEVQAVKWASVEKVIEDARCRAHNYTVWFLKGLLTVLELANGKFPNSCKLIE